MPSHTEILYTTAGFFGTCRRTAKCTYWRNALKETRWLLKCLSPDVSLRTHQNKWAVLAHKSSAFDILKMIMSATRFACVGTCFRLRSAAHWHGEYPLYVLSLLQPWFDIICWPWPSANSHAEFQLWACTSSPAKWGYYLALSWTQCTTTMTGTTTRRWRWQAITVEVLVGESGTILKKNWVEFFL